MAARKTAGLLKTLTAGATIAQGDLLRFGSDDETVIPGSSGTDDVIGIADAGALTGEAVGVQFSGIAEVKAGGTITRGAFISSDSDGKAIVAVPGDRVIGFSTAGGALGDLTPVLIAVSRDRIV